VRDLLAAFSATGNASVSTFELLSSGAVRSLCNFLQGSDLMSADDNPLPLLERLGAFVDIALPAGSGNNPPMLVLVQKLQAALSAVEKFPVRINKVQVQPSMASMYGYGYQRFAGGGGEEQLSRLSTPS
jgi:hypothetical protein